MSTLTQPLDTFIDEQMKTGAVSSEVEAEQMIQTAVFERVLDRKLERAEQQADNGQCYEANDDFIAGVLTEARSRLNLSN